MEIVSGIILSPLYCIGWLIVGAIAGAIANNVMRSEQPLIWDIVLGLIGSVIGGFLLSLLRLDTPEGGLVGILANIVVATIGAIVLIAIVRAVRRA
jgi:uncharacterized membrane protein YeaQ/YmgE (transglycosylase-associated protein family)